MRKCPSPTYLGNKVISNPFLLGEEADELESWVLALVLRAHLAVLTNLLDTIVSSQNITWNEFDLHRN